MVLEKQLKMTPGTYRLKCDVQNPEADRRVKNDWRKAGKWKEGTVFIVEADTTMATERREQLKLAGVNVSAMPDNVFVYLNMRPATGDFAHMSLHDSSLAFQSLSANLEPIAETTDAMLTRLDINRRYSSWQFFTFLCNKFGNAWFEQNWTEYMQSPEDDE
jgi:hypothetical protein